MQQERLWYFERTEPGTAVYNLPGAFRLRGPLDEGCLEQALTDFVARHDVLRMGIGDRLGVPTVITGPPEPVPLARVDLAGPSAEEAERAAVAWLEADADVPFTLDHPSLIRFALLRLGPQDAVLALVAHHLAWDGWCFDLFMSEMQELYEAHMESRPARLPPLPVRYRDYAAWQRRYLEGPAGMPQLAYWRQALAAGVPDLDMPTDRARPPVMTYQGRRATFRLERDALEAVRAAAAASRATTNMVLLAAFKALLARYSGQDVLVVGMPVQGRVHAELERVIGFFVNTLVLRTDVSDDPAFTQLLERVREASVGALEHRLVPFEVLARQFGRRDPSRTPLYQVMFTHQNTRTRVTRWGPLRLGTIARDTHATHTDLGFWVREYDDYLDGGLDYRTDLFDRNSMQELLARYRRLLDAAVRAPDTPISRLPLLTPAEHDRLTRGRAGQPDVASPVMLLLDVVAGQVTRRPQAVAVADASVSLSYGELWTRSERVALGLASAGVRTGDVVGVLVSRRADLVSLLLGILRAGAVYLPVAPDLPTERIRFMLEDARVRLTVVEEEFASLMPPDGASVRSTALLDGNPEPGPLAPVGAEDLAYVLYTSGSTGTPKAVEVTHGALGNFLGSMAAEPGLLETDILLAVTTLSFDIAGLELFLPLWTGARTVLADDTDDGVALARRLSSAAVTVLQATPATWRMLLDGGWSGRLRLALCGGETMPRELAEILLERADQVWNLYGPTETTIWSTLDRVTHGTGPISIGRPIANTRVYVLDRHGEPVPAGVVGEIWIGGAGVARGYRHRPDLTADRFRSNPFVRDERVYRTGDLGRWSRDGRLEHLGRTDFQVKIQGFRIELGEVEAALERFADVKQAVVVAHGSEEDRRLAAYVRYGRGTPPTTTEVRHHLRGILPPYMIPGVIVPVDRLPLTPNGKIDRRALPDPFATPTSAARTWEPPATDLEAAIAAIWADLLRVERVGRHDNFFELGGHSLLSIRAVAAIEAAHGCRVDPRTFFFQTLSQIATTAEDGSARQP